MLRTSIKHGLGNIIHITSASSFALLRFVLSPSKQLHIMYGMRSYRTLIKRVLMYGCETNDEAMLRQRTCGRKRSVIESYSNGVWRANAQALCGTLAQGVNCVKDKMRVNIQLNKTKPQHDAQQSHVLLLYIQSISARSFQ